MVYLFVKVIDFFSLVQYFVRLLIEYCSFISWVIDSLDHCIIVFAFEFSVSQLHWINNTKAAVL